MHPTCGPTQPDDIPGNVRYKTYEVSDGEKKENMKYLKGEKKERKKEKKKKRKILSMFHLQRSRTFESKPFKLK